MEEEYKGMGGERSRINSVVFFIIGLIGAIGLRAVLILNHYNHFWAKISWYSAIIAYISFYYYRLIIENKRRKLIIQNRLREKIIDNSLDREDRLKIKSLIDSMLISKLRLNFIVLLILSFLALIIEICLDFIIGF